MTAGVARSRGDVAREKRVAGALEALGKLTVAEVETVFGGLAGTPLGDLIAGSVRPRAQTTVTRRQEADLEC